MADKIDIAETERLILRRYVKEDIQDLFEYLSDKEIEKFPQNDWKCIYGQA